MQVESARRKIWRKLGMDIAIILTATVLTAVGTAESIENELYVSFEPLPGQRDGWPVARAVRMQFMKRSEEGREFRRFHGCQILQSLADIAREAYRTPRHSMRRISKEEMRSFESRCERLGVDERTMPGTKWCGSGNEATDENDLGSLYNVDSCCRDHDHCDNIASGETKYGLRNNGTYTMMNCECEDKFSACLETVISKASFIGYFPTLAAIKGLKLLYFDLYGNGCFNLTCSSGRSESSAKCSNPTAAYTGESGFAAKVINLFG